MSKYLYGASVQGIQEYIFASNELKSIVGASELIKSINAKVEEDYKDNIIINAAGNVKLIFDESEQGKLETLVCDFLKKIKQECFGLTISQAVVKFEEGGLKEALGELEKRLSMQRNKPDMPLDMSIGIQKLSRKSARPIVENGKDMATLQKEAENTSKGNIPKNRKNKTAIIHADGNGLGILIASMLKDAMSDKEIVKRYKEFSTNLDKATKEAFDEAKKEMQEKGIRDVILGGDDMTIICNANDALEFTNRFLTAFEQKTKEYLGGEGLTACAGVAFCNQKYPFHYAVALAESLCSYAKNASREHSSVMFHNIQSASFTSFEEYIDKELTLHNNKETIHLHYGPYFIKEHLKGYATLQSFLYLGEAFKAKGSPRARLREWLTILGQNADAAKERLRRINEMMDLKDDLYKKSALKNCFRQFNDDIKLEELTIERNKEKFTPVYDIDTYLSVIDYEPIEQAKECE